MSNIGMMTVFESSCACIECRPARTYGSSLMIIEGHPDACLLAYAVRSATFWRDYGEK